jgi:plastocyanin
MLSHARAALALLIALLLVRPAWAEPPSEWPGTELPLPLAVRTPEDMAFKSVAERQYLIFNLLAGGKLAYDQGDMASAAARWEELLRVPGLSMEIEAVVKPLVAAARRKAGGKAEVGLPLPPPPRGYSLLSPPEPAKFEEKPEPAKAPAKAPREEVRRPQVSATGAIEGTVLSGASGAAGAVVWLTRAEGPTPKPRPAPTQTVLQRGKRFLPHVLVVPTGTEVAFLNEDQMFHNVFSLTKPNAFDLGLYEKGAARNKVFTEPGPVRLLCNIHASMSAFVYVVDSPWYAQADARGRFELRGVPPGEYVLHSWHELSAKPSTRHITVGEGLVSVAATVTNDADRPAFVPDKAGHPRQTQLGY